MSTKITPSLESITVKGKYHVQITEFASIEKMLNQVFSFPNWKVLSRIGESLNIVRCGTKLATTLIKARRNMKLAQSILTLEKDKDMAGIYLEDLKSFRPGLPFHLSITTIEHYENGILVEVQCKPAMWYQISQLRGMDKFTENQVQEAQIECKTLVKQTMSIFRGKEVEPVSVYPIIQGTEIKSRLLNLGLKEVVSQLDKAERHIVQNNFTESLKSSRTAFEKMIDWQMKKRGLEQTNNYKNDLERLKSKGYLDKETTELLQSYYKCLSNIAVHEKGEVEPGIYEAQMGYGITLIMLDYLASKLP